MSKGKGKERREGGKGKWEGRRREGRNQGKWKGSKSGKENEGKKGKVRKEGGNDER